MWLVTIFRVMCMDGYDIKDGKSLAMNRFVFI